MKFILQDTIETIITEFTLMNFRCCWVDCSVELLKGAKELLQLQYQGQGTLSKLLERKKHQWLSEIYVINFYLAAFHNC